MDPRRWRHQSRRRAQQAGSGGGGPPADTDPPGVASIASDTLGTYVRITHDESMDQTSTPAAGAFAFSLATITVGTPAWFSATELDVPVIGRLLQGESLTLSYTAGGSPIQDLAGNDLPNFAGSVVTNNSTIVLETVVDTLTGSWSIADTEYVPGRAISGRLQAGGGGGDGGAGVNNNRSGGAGELRLWTVAAAAAGGYSGTSGAGGALGTNGTATAGGDSTVSDTGGVIATAIGGSPGNAATGTSGVGGTGGSGGTGRDGGNGSSSAPGAAIIGGSTSGTATAAVGGNPGEPDGSTSRTGGPGCVRGCGGPCTAANAGIAGGAGFSVVTYQRAVVAASRPRVTAINYGRDVSLATTRNVSFGAPPVGALLRTAVATINQPCSMTGHTEVLDVVSGTGANLATYKRDADGSDPVAVATASTRAAWITCVVEGATAAANITAGSATHSATQPDPPSLDHGSVVDALWGVTVALAQNPGHWELTSYPASYGSRLLVPPNQQATGPAIAMCTLPLSATQAQNPGAFTFSTAPGTSVTATSCTPKA